MWANQLTDLLSILKVQFFEKSIDEQPIFHLGI